MIRELREKFCLVLSLKLFVYLEKKCKMIFWILQISFIYISNFLKNEGSQSTTVLQNHASAETPENQELETQQDELERLHEQQALLQKIVDQQKEVRKTNIKLRTIFLATFRLNILYDVH